MVRARDACAQCFPIAFTTREQQRTHRDKEDVRLNRRPKRATSRHKTATTYGERDASNRGKEEIDEGRDTATTKNPRERTNK